MNRITISKIQDALKLAGFSLYSSVNSKSELLELVNKAKYNNSNYGYAYSSTDIKNFLEELGFDLSYNHHTRNDYVDMIENEIEIINDNENKNIIKKEFSIDQIQKALKEAGCYRYDEVKTKKDLLNLLNNNKSKYTSTFLNNFFLKLGINELQSIICEPYIDYIENNFYITDELKPKIFTIYEIRTALERAGLYDTGIIKSKSDLINYLKNSLITGLEHYPSEPIRMFINNLNLNVFPRANLDKNGLLDFIKENIEINEGDSKDTTMGIRIYEAMTIFNINSAEEMIDVLNEIGYKGEVVPQTLLSDKVVLKIKKYLETKSSSNEIITETEDNMKINYENDLAKYEPLISDGKIIILNQSKYQTSTDNKFYYKISNDEKLAIDVTHTDNIWLQFNKQIKDLFVLVNVDDNEKYKPLAYGSFREKDGKYFLELSSKNIHIDFSSNNRAYKIIFMDEDEVRYSANFEAVSLELPNDDEHVLCIDFGTSNTSVGTWSDDDNSEMFKLVEFDDITDFKKITTSYLLPTTVYIRKYSNEDNMGNDSLLFGYEAMRHIKESDYNPKGSYFLNIKQWLSAKEDFEIDCKDEGNKAFKLPAKEIIASYLKHIVNLAEIKLKKHFVKLHFSAPVKLKSRFNKLVTSIFNEKNNHKVIPVSESLDEGLAIIYDYISNLRRKIDNNEDVKLNGKVMVIDCGGGTTDVASCRYAFDKSDDTGISVDISTKFEKGFNFGGNKLTYLIFQLLKIKLSEYYKNSDKKFSIDDLFVGEADSYLKDIDSCFKEHKEFCFYNKLEEASSEAEWVLPTDFGNKKYVDGNNNISLARRNFIYLWNWAERLKIKFFSSKKMASFFFTKEEDIKSDIKDKIMYFYVDKNGEENNSKCTLIKTDDVPDIELNNKELAILLSPQIYYTLSLIMPSESKDLDGVKIRLSGQSSRINLFRELLKEFIRGKDTRDDEKTDSMDKKLACVKGCIQCMSDNEYGALNCSLKVETPSIPYTVTSDRGPNTSSETLFDGTSIKTSSEGINLMFKINISKRQLRDGSLRFAVNNRAYNKEKLQYQDFIKLNVDLNKAIKLNSLSELIKTIKDNSLTGIEDYKSYNVKIDETTNEKIDIISKETLLESLEKDLNDITSDAKGKLLIFVVPNNDGCGFILYQVAKLEDSGSMQYYLTGEDMLYYEKIEDFKSIFDGCNCK